MNRRNFILGAAGATLTFTVPTGILGQEATPELTQGFLFGNAHDLVPLGTGEGVEIVSLSPVMQVSMFALVRNNTDQAIGMKGVTGSARLDGDLVGTVESAANYPYVIEAGGIGIAHMSFEAALDFGEAAPYEFDLEVDYEEPNRDLRIDVNVSEVNLTPSSVVGMIENQSGAFVHGPFNVGGVFITEEGEITSYFGGWVSLDEELPAGESVAFDATIFTGFETQGPTTDFFLGSAVGWAF